MRLDKFPRFLPAPGIHQQSATRERNLQQVGLFQFYIGPVGYPLISSAMLLALASKNLMYCPTSSSISLSVKPVPRGTRAGQEINFNFRQQGLHSLSSGFSNLAADFIVGALNFQHRKTYLFFFPYAFLDLFISQSDLLFFRC
jgi:hypothetical protein